MIATNRSEMFKMIQACHPGTLLEIDAKIDLINIKTCIAKVTDGYLTNSLSKIKCKFILFNDAELKPGAICFENKTYKFSRFIQDSNCIPAEYTSMRIENLEFELNLVKRFLKKNQQNLLNKAS